MHDVPGLWRGWPPGRLGLISVGKGGVEVGKVHLERVRPLLALLGPGGVARTLSGLLPGRLDGQVGCLNGLPGDLGRPPRARRLGLLPQYLRIGMEVLG